jgi:hypothetical protein
MKRIFPLLISITVFIMLTFGAAYAATPGGEDDPLISLSYISGFITNIISRVNTMIDSAYGALKTVTSSQLTQIESEIKKDDVSSGYKILSINSGGTVTIPMGSSVNLISGTLRLTTLNGTLINVSEGTVVSKNDIIFANNRYFAAENTTAVFTVYSSNAKITVNGAYTMTLSGTLPVSLFKDVEGHWAEQYITALSSSGIVSGMGDGVFMPDSTMTRGMFVTIMGRLSGADKNAYTSSKFSDVDIKAWYGPYVAWASEKGISTGFEDGTFAPDNTITREQMAVMIMRYAALSGKTLPQISEPKTFTDDEGISSWAKSSVYSAQKAGLISGRSDNSFDPKGTATRAEVCAIVYRLNKALNT